MDLGTLLRFAAQRVPDTEALVDGDLRLTYAAWDARVNAVAHALRARGLAPRERFVLCLKNSEGWLTTYFALQRLGAIAVPINFRFASNEVRYCLEDAGAAGVLFEPATRGAVLEALADLPSCRLRVFAGADAPPGALPLEALAEEPCPEPRPEPRPEPVEGRVDDGELSLILYTSGTTGRPKGVPRSHRNAHAGALAHIVQCGYAWGERTLGIMPLYHTMGIHSLHSMVMLGGTLVVMRDWDAAAAVDLIARERISALYLIPTLYYDLLRAPNCAGADLSCVRKLAYAGAPMLSSLTQSCVQRFRPQVFVNHYGSTEVYTFSVCDRVAAKPGCAGRPGLHAALRIVTADPERRVLPHEVVKPGELGEVIASLASAEAFRGYWNRPEATAKALRDGWYFTGDLGALDAEGDLTVSGRVDDMIISGGENIHPIEVEEVLARHPHVADAAVVGTPDERWGQKVTAFVVPGDPALTAGAIEAFCKSSRDLALFKRPREVIFVKAIPKTASGKILRRLLRDGQYERT
jgi:2-furoate---CoA ligase